MSLQTDLIFVRALRSNADLIAALPAGDVYNTAIALPDEEAENAPVPYIIVTFDGMQNDATTKDDPYEGGEDKVQIGIEVVAETRPQLAQLTKAVRKTIHDFMTTLDDSDVDYQLVPYDYTVSAQPVQYDSLKPCYWQTLQYQCSTKNDIDDE